MQCKGGLDDWMNQSITCCDYIALRRLGASQGIRGGASPSWDATSSSSSSRWLHGNSIPNIGCHYFWPGLIGSSSSC
jgi:hypothetical protein